MYGGTIYNTPRLHFAVAPQTTHLSENPYISMTYAPTTALNDVLVVGHGVIIRCINFITLCNSYNLYDSYKNT